jgi:hypothetical protein
MSDNPTLTASFRQLVPTVILAILTAVVTTWFSIRDAQQEMRFKAEVMDQAIKTLSAANAQNASALQQISIEQARQAKDIENLKERRK